MSWNHQGHWKRPWGKLPAWKNIPADCDKVEYVCGKSAGMQGKIGTARNCFGLWGCVGLWEGKHDANCRSSFRWFLVNTVCIMYVLLYVCVLVIIVQMQFYGFSEEKNQEENWQFGLFVSHKQPRHSFLHIFLKRTYYKAFFSSIGMQLCAKIKNNKYCCESTAYYLKLQMHFCSGAMFWVHSSLGTTLTFGANLKVSGGKWYIRNYSGKKHKNCKGGKWSHNLKKERDAKLNFRVTFIFPFEVMYGWGCVQST